jgi:hypothetical protein
MAAAVRWAARILSVPVLLVWGFSIIVCAVGPVRSLPATLPDSVAYVAMIVALLALAVAWKWELAGSLLSLAGVAVGAAYNWRGLLFPGAVVPLVAVLFLLSWWLNRRTGQE